MQYFEVLFSNGKKAIAYNAPKSYLESCLAQTKASFTPTTEDNAKQINSYYNINTDSGWHLLRLHALEASI